MDLLMITNTLYNYIDPANEFNLIGNSHIFLLKKTSNFHIDLKY